MHSFALTISRGGAVVARQAHNLEVIGSNPVSATKEKSNRNIGCFSYLYINSILTLNQYFEIFVFLLNKRYNFSVERDIVVQFPTELYLHIWVALPALKLIET